MPANEDPTDLVGQRDEAEAAQAQAQLAAEQDANDLRWLMTDTRGRRIAARILGRCHEHHSSFNTNALVMSRMEGERNIAIWLKGEITEASFEGYVQMLREIPK